jgi:hypothetical protein
MFEIANTPTNVLIVNMILVWLFASLTVVFIFAIKEKKTEIWGVGKFEGNDAVIVGTCQLITSLLGLVITIIFLFT